MAKVPNVGRSVREMADNACQALRMKMDGIETWRKVRKAVFRCISDWEGRGSTRTAYEEVNLAIHADAASALAAECILTTPHAAFYGSFFVQLVEGAITGRSTAKRTKASAGVSTTTWTVSQPGKTQAKGYGYRPMSNDFAYLSPWEFVRDWEVVRTGAPPVTSVVSNDDRGFTKWCSDVARVEVSLGARAVAGDHYEVVEPTEEGSYVYLPAHR